MLRFARLIPFLLVVASAVILVVWNSVLLAGAYKTARDRPPARRLDAAAAEISKLMANRAPNSTNPETELAKRAGSACDILNRQVPVFENLGATISETAEPLERVETALSAACAIRARFARPLSADDVAEADAEMQTRLTESVEGVRSTQARLEAAHPAPASDGTAAVDEPGSLRGPLLGLACGLICLVFARRPQPVPAAVSEPVEDDWQPVLEPIVVKPPLVQQPPVQPKPPPEPTNPLLFCDAFDRAPLPMVLLDGSGRILRLNAQAEAVAGRSTDELRRQLYWGAPSAEPIHEPIGGVFPLHDEPAPVPEAWNQSLFFDNDFSQDTIEIRTEPAASHHGVAPAITAAANELESELTLIGGHCEMLLEEGRSSGNGAVADLELLREATRRAIQSVRRLLGGLTEAGNGNSRN